MEITLKALAISEILTLILSYVPTSDSELSRKNLLHCALVSRSWNHPSLKLLWTYLTDLVPLFKIMAPVRVTDVTTMTLPQNGSSSTSRRFPQVLFNEVCEFEPHVLGQRVANWDRFCYYASFVRSAQITILPSNGTVFNQTPPNYHPKMIKQASSIAMAMGLPLLRRTTKLTLILHDAESSEAIIDLLHEGMQELCISLSPDGFANLSLVLLRLRHCGSSLTRLEITSPNVSANDTVADPLVNALQSMQKLQILQLPFMMVYPDVWNAIHSTTVKTLYLTRSGPIPLKRSEFQLKAHGPDFLALTLSQLEAESLLSSQSCSHSILKLHITIDSAGTASNIAPLLANLPAALPNLKSLSMILRGNHPTLSSPTFVPLGKMALTTLDIQVPNIESFTDQGFEIILCSLPRMVDLKLLSSSPSAPRATLRTLGLIAQHCSNIRNVAIRLDCSKSALPESTSFPHPFGRSLQKLDMEFSPVEDEMGVAMALIHLFPQRIPDIQSAPVNFGYAWLQYQPPQSSTQFASSWRGVHSALLALYRIVQTARARDSERLAELETQLNTQDRLLLEAHSRVLELEGGVGKMDS